MKALLLAAAAGAAWAQTPDISDILRRVAMNQAKSQELRTNYVYRQKQTLKMIRGGGKIAREEHREYSIAPKVRGIDRQLVAFDGRYSDKGHYVSFDKPGFRWKGMDLDGELLDALSDGMTHDKNSRDGISNDLFPLTYHRQLRYQFTLVKTGEYRGKSAYLVRFEPKKKPSIDDDAEGGAWKGEAWIDAAEYQPIAVTTDLAWKMPTAVKVLLGTNVRGVGFSVTYKKFEDGLWFPVSYGGEFDIRAVFFYKRTMSVNLTNSDFRRADVESHVAYSLEDK